MDWMITHFGKNPNNGGSPPNERREMNNENCAHELKIRVLEMFLKFSEFKRKMILSKITQ